MVLPFRTGGLSGLFAFGGKVKAFDRAFEWVLQEEGPPSNDPDDPGRYTKFGISQKYHPDVDVPNLTPRAAERIYRRKYWNKIQGESLPPDIAIVTFDAAVQHDPVEAVEFLQRALRVRVDGDIGPRTLAAARAAGPHVIPWALGFRARRYLELVEKKPYKRKWINGWLIRLFQLQQCALRED